MALRFFIIVIISYQKDVDWAVDIADAQSWFGSTRQRCHAETGAGVSERGRAESVAISLLHSRF